MWRSQMVATTATFSASNYPSGIAAKQRRCSGAVVFVAEMRTVSVSLLTRVTAGISIGRTFMRCHLGATP